MSKKSKKILAYLMFVAALCGTPAVSEARGGSDGQVKTEKASTAQRGNFSQSFISHLIKNYGIEALFGSGIFGFAKLSKVGDLNALAKYALGIKNADLKKLESLNAMFEEEKKQFENEKGLFEQGREKAIKDYEKLIVDKHALELKNNNLDAKVKESEKKIKDLKNRNDNLQFQLSDLMSNKDQYFSEGDKRKLDLLLPCLPNLIDSKMSGEFTNSYSPKSKWNGPFGLDQIDLEPFSIENVVRVALVEYNANYDVVGKAEKIELGTGDFLNDVKIKAKEKLGQDATVEEIALKGVGLDDFGVRGLARYSFIVKNDEGVEKVVAAYFPVADAQEKNVENNDDDENINENNNVNNENIENNENGNINENNNVNNEENNENLNENVNVNDNNVDNNNLNNEVNENNV